MNDSRGTLALYAPRSIARLHAKRDGLTRWLLEDALPLWHDAGTDRQRGGFFEQLDPAGAALEAPRRTRVVARQTYVFSVAARLGWAGPAPAAVEHGLAFLLGRLKQADGSFLASVAADGTIVDGRFDLYEQAFALFALAHAHRRAPGAHPGLEHAAQALLRTLDTLYKHPLAGYQEGRPPRVPLRANPHMHLFEAALAWMAAGTPHSRRWMKLADALAALALERLIHARSGALLEIFGLDWRPLPADARGQAVEPGHQFEWAWLLMRWGTLRQHAPALRAARRLVELAEQHGVCRRRGVAVNTLDGGLAVSDDTAKLWPQTERIKAWCALAETAATADALSAAVDGIVRAIDGLQPYLAHPVPGLWHETMQADASLPLGPSRASSFYHIVCAIETLQQLPI